MISEDDESWIQEQPGLVRPFIVTRGRASTRLHDLDMITLVVAIRPASDAATLDREYGEILRLCQGRPLSVAEIAAHLDLLVAAVKVLISDLIDSGHLIFRSPPPSASDGRPDLQLLQAVLDGIRKL